MGSKLKFYNLYYNNVNEQYTLFEGVQESFSNSNENEYERVCIEAENTIPESLKESEVTLIGSMQEFPIGDDIYEIESGNYLNLYYYTNILNESYIILGTGISIESFINEAKDEYGYEVDKSNVHKISALFIKT